MGPCKSVLISEVSLIRRFPYNSCNIMLYNSGPQTLVCIVEVSIIGGVRFRRFHCITKNGLFTEAQLLLLSCYGNRLFSCTELGSVFVIINLWQAMVHAPLT